VDVAVTVTVRSEELVEYGRMVVPLVGPSESSEPVVLTSELVVVDPSAGVVEDEIREVVLVMCMEESVTVPVVESVVPVSPGTETETVAEPTFGNDTIVPEGAAVTSVTLETEVPSFTLISTTLAVTVASGALGRRYMP
jgi:hypothetical protein